LTTARGPATKRETGYADDVRIIHEKVMRGLHAVLQDYGDREIVKAPGSWCPHCKPGRGCLIYGARPAECRAFSCLWLRDDRLDERWKPSRSRLVLTTSPDGIEVRCDPGLPDAWRREPFRGQIRRWAVSGETHDVTVVVITGEKMMLITSDREIDLGVVRPDQRIVREISGTRVVDVKVVQASELESPPAGSDGLGETFNSRQLIA
jgi:hypothetical protein